MTPSTDVAAPHASDGRAVLQGQGGGHPHSPLWDRPHLPGVPLVSPQVSHHLPLPHTRQAPLSTLNPSSDTPPSHLKTSSQPPPLHSCPLFECPPFLHMPIRSSRKGVYSRILIHSECSSMAPGLSSLPVVPPSTSTRPDRNGRCDLLRAPQQSPATGHTPSKHSFRLQLRQGPHPGGPGGEVAHPHHALPGPAHPCQGVPPPPQPGDRRPPPRRGPRLPQQAADRATACGDSSSCRVGDSLEPKPSHFHIVVSQRSHVHSSVSGQQIVQGLTGFCPPAIRQIQFENASFHL